MGNFTLSEKLLIQKRWNKLMKRTRIPTPEACFNEFMKGTCLVVRTKE